MKTKSILLLIIGIGFFLNSYAQLNYHLPTDNAYISVNNKRFIFDGDTIIGDNRYTKVLLQEGKSETEYYEPEYYGAVREDAIGGKIYGIQTVDGVERLLADFDVKAGDEVTVYCFWPHPEHPSKRLVKVESIGSIEIDGQYRKQVNLVNDVGDEEWADYWIEGLGSIHGLFSPSPEAVADQGDTPVLLCLHIDDNLIWQNPIYKTCYLYYGTNIPKGILMGFDFYPSIVEDNLYVKTDHGTYTYQIHNTQGVLMLSGRVSEILDLSALLQGNYIISFYGINNRLIYSGRFMKK